jgi:hypothetical protein
MEENWVMGGLVVNLSSWQKAQRLAKAAQAQGVP